MFPLYAVECPVCKMLTRGPGVRGRDKAIVPNHLPRQQVTDREPCKKTAKGQSFASPCEQPACEGSGKIGEVVNYRIPGMLT